MKRTLYLAVLTALAILTVACGTPPRASGGDRPWMDPDHDADGVPEEAEVAAKAPVERSLAETARKLADPTAAIGKLGLFYDHVRYDGDLPGADRQSSNSLTFQPALPKPLTPSTRLFFRPAFPLYFDRPYYDASEGGFTDEGIQLGDISYDAAYGGNFPSGLIYLVGVNGTIPTATDRSVGSSQWTMGPEFLIGHASKRFVAGVLVSHRWDIAETNSSAREVSVTGGQYFYAFILDDGWTIGAGPTFSYNHEASSGNRATLPIAAGFTKTTQIGGLPVRFGVEAWYHAVRPDEFAPEWQIRLSIVPVVELPW